MYRISACDGLTTPCILHDVLAAAPLAAQSAGPRAHAAVLLAGGISENIAAPGVGASVAPRVRQWRGVRLEAELARLGFAIVDELCGLASSTCDTRQLSGAASASATRRGASSGPAGRGVYAQAGVGPYGAWGSAASPRVAGARRASGRLGCRRAWAEGHASRSAGARGSRACARSLWSVRWGGAEPRRYCRLGRRSEGGRCM